MLLQSSLAYFLAKLVPSALALLNNALLTRVLSVRDFGLYGLGLSVVAIVGSVGFDWIGITYCRFFQPDDTTDGRLQSSVTFVYLAVCLVTFVLGGAAILFVPKTEYKLMLLTCVSGAWMVSWFELMTRRLIMGLLPAAYFAMNLTRGALILGSSWSVAWWTGSSYWAITATCVSSLVATFSMRRILDWRVSPRQVDRTLVTAVLVFGWPLAVTLLLNGMVSNMARPMLAILSDPASVAFFSAGQLLIQSPLSLVGAGVAASTYAHAVRAVSHGPAELARQLEKNFLVLLGIILPAGVGAALVAPDLLPILLAPRYAGPVLRLTPILSTLVVVGVLRAHYFDTAFQLGMATKRLIWVTLTSAGTAFATGIPLILRFGYMGSAIGLLLAESAALVVSALTARRVIHVPLPWTETLKIGGATLLMAGCVACLPSSPNNILCLVAAIVVGAVSYAAGLIAFNPNSLRQTAVATIRRRLRR